MRPKQVPTRGAGPRMGRLWWQEPEVTRLARQAREDADERRQRQVAHLRFVARFSRADAIAPDDDDPLESIDPTPESDIDFPMSLQQWRETWHIEDVEDVVSVIYVSEDDTSNE
jgi:hypothetical protein